MQGLNSGPPGGVAQTSTPGGGHTPTSWYFDSPMHTVYGSPPHISPASMHPRYASLPRHHAPTTYLNDVPLIA